MRLATARLRGLRGFLAIPGELFALMSPWLSAPSLTAASPAGTRAVGSLSTVVDTPNEARPTTTSTTASMGPGGPFFSSADIDGRWLTRTADLLLVGTSDGGTGEHR